MVTKEEWYAIPLKWKTHKNFRYFRYILDILDIPAHAAPCYPLDIKYKEEIVLASQEAISSCDS